MNGTPHALAATLAAAMLLAAAARAQTSASDQVKSTLAARFEASGVRGFSLEAVPADTPQPADARVIGNCEGGAYKVLYRRWGGSAGPAASAITPAAPASAARPAERPARTAAASAPSPAPPPAQAAPRPKTDAAPSGGRASEVVAAPLPAPTPARVAPVAPPPPVEAPSIERPWPWSWIGALALLVLAVGFWRWRAHRSAYDEAGLPRGPRL